MKPTKKTAEQLIQDAKGYSKEEFGTKPGENFWSLGQVYRHIALVTHQCLANIDLCTAQQGKNKKTALGPALFSWMGSFPPVKIRVKKIQEGVEHLYTPAETSIEEAIQLLQASIEQMELYLPMAEAAPQHQRIKHWAGGWFTARQWYQSAEMHIRHHLRQKKRIDAFLGR